MIRALLALLFIAATILGAKEARAEPVVTVTQVADDRFVADFALDADAPAWLFWRTNVTQRGGRDWRAESWTVETPGVELVRLGPNDALVAKGGGKVPRRVRVAFAPFTDGLEKDYVPALRLGGKATALFTGHFAVVPAPSLAMARRLDGDLTGIPDHDATGFRMRARAGSALLWQGETVEEARIDSDTYVTFGEARAVEESGIVAIVDPALPEWLRDRLRTQLPALFAFYGERLGPRKPTTPQLLVSWVGATPGVVSIGGSVIGDTVVFRLEGEGLARPSPAEYHNVLRLFAHEVAHFWIGETVTYGDSGSAWVAEGSADLLAVRAAEHLDPTYDGTPYLEQAVGACGRFLANGPLVEAPARGDFRAFYDCGMVFSMVGEEAASRRGSDYFGFWRTMIARHRAGGVVDGPAFLAGIRSARADRRAVALMERLALEGSRRPAEDLDALLRLGRVGASRRADGTVALR